MRRILHLSDLHFGRVRPELVEPLLAAVSALRPDLVVISGDLTQRARVGQYVEARHFLDRLTAPRLIVPGNHDVPLDNLLRRLFLPWRRWRRWIGRELEPRYEDAELLVLGLNTVSPFVWQRGWVERHKVAHTCAAFAESAGRTRIVVAHHPFAQAPEEARKAPMRGARRALAALAECGADIFLGGHLHSWRAAPYGHVEWGGHSVLLVQAGTGLSTRTRGEVNDFNLLHVEPGEVRVERFAAEASDFRRVADARFRRGASGWAEVASAAQDV